MEYHYFIMESSNTMKHTVKTSVEIKLHVNQPIMHSGMKCVDEGSLTQ